MPSWTHQSKMPIRNLLHDIIAGYLEDEALMADQLSRNQGLMPHAGDKQDVRPHGLVVCSIWEYDKSFLSLKMFERALESLTRQCQPFGFDLDFVIVINNGGSSEPGMREELVHRMTILLNAKLPNHTVETLATIPPASALERTAPWIINADLPSREERSSGMKEKALLVIQPFNSLNKGKISALRDVAHFLKGQIARNSYSADFVFQMDAETILRFRRPPRPGITSPFGELYRFFSENNLTAVGTRDRFSVFDPDTGRPLVKPVGTLQIGWEIRNSGSPMITLPGGALMAKVTSYVAAMIQLTHYFPGLVAEDYAYTKLLRYAFANVNRRFEDHVELHPGIVHLNRTPDDARAAFRQLETWRHQTNAVDFIFPRDNFIPMDFLKATLLLVARRIRDIRYYGLFSIAMLIQDAIGLPTSCRIAYSSIRSDIERNRSS